MKNLLLKLFLPTILFGLFFQLNAQERSKYGFELIEFLKTVDENEMVPLLIEGKNLNLDELVQQFNGNTRLQIGKLYAIEIPAKHVKVFSNNEAVLSIQFSTANGQAFSDTMLVNLNMDSVIQQSAPLRTNYTGKGVVLGVIDSGIELEHGDFKDSTGKTRIKYIWDQKAAYQPARQAKNYTYGVEWTASDIDGNLSTHDDDAQQFGHGSNVTGVAASNGLATGNFRGVAPEVNIISVATDFYKPNWLQTVVEAVDYIFSKADSLGMPCVINASIGTYEGSHDGKDIAARMIDSLIKQKSGRAFVCAAGNAGNFPYHLQHTPNNDTVFTWFESNPFKWSGYGGLYFEFWADTADFDQMQFSIGADRSSGGTYEFRGRTAFDSIQNRLNVIYNDSILNPQGLRLAAVKTYAELSEGRYKVEVAIINPDSSSYLFRLETKGTGKLDLWSSYSLFRHAKMRRLNLPSPAQFPMILNYKKPDTLLSIASSFTSLPSAITVGNYVNRSSYIDVSNTLITVAVTPGEISINSSLGPNRNGIQKPTISSAGDYMFAAGRLATIKDAIQSNPSKVSADSLHFRNGGTSMASPTIAGMIALYFEQCPEATIQQVKTDLIATAKSDQFTPSLPNDKWGYGKADAFQFLKGKVFKASISGASLACEGDTVVISGNDTNYTYLWNNMESGSQISVTKTKEYFAWAKNSEGCRTATDTVKLRFNPLPAKPIISQNGKQLSISSLGEYQWYFNQAKLAGETDSILTTIQAGDYYCLLTDSNSCSISSDTVTLLTTSLVKQNKKSFTLHPNPSNGFVTLQSPRQKIIDLIEVYELSGKIIFREINENKKQQLQLNLSHLVRGIYFMKIYSSDQIELHKIIRQ